MAGLNLNQLTSLLIDNIVVDDDDAAAVIMKSTDENVKLNIIIQQNIIKIENKNKDEWR